LKEEGNGKRSETRKQEGRRKYEREEEDAMKSARVENREGRKR